MKVIRSTKQVNRLILQLFLVTTFFVHYQTTFIPGTLHGWMLIPGLMFTLPTLLKKLENRCGRIPVDYGIVVFLGLLFILGFLINYSNAALISLRAYMLTLICYIFVKENISTISMTFIFSLMKYFLLCNGLLVILQFVTGEFYPATYLASGNPPLLLPSGFSDGATKNGMLISFALSFMFGRFLWHRKRASYLELLIFIVGLLSLLLSASRAGILGFIIVVLMGSIFATFKRRRFRLNRKNIALVAFIFLIPLGTIYYGEFTFENLLELRDPDSPQSGGKVVVYKLVTIDDDSLLERITNINRAGEMLIESPLHVLSVGFGLGSFIALNRGSNVHNSYVEVLFETGIYGFLAFLFLIVHVIRKALSRRGAVEILPALFALVSVMVFMAFHDVLRGRLFWIAFGIVSSCAYMNKGPKRSTELNLKQIET